MPVALVPIPHDTRGQPCKLPLRWTAVLDGPAWEYLVLHGCATKVDVVRISLQGMQHAWQTSRRVGGIEHCAVVKQSGYRCLLSASEDGRIKCGLFRHVTTLQEWPDPCTDAGTREAP